MDRATERRMYLDYAATTPVDPAVRRAMLPYLGDSFGNPSSLHSFGQEAQTAVDRSRETVARLLGVGFREVVFTGSATEANNLALRGIVRAYQRHIAAKKDAVTAFTPRIIISSVEHESVLETARELERAGEVEVTVLAVNEEGVVDLRMLEQALDDRTVLVSIQYVNNETGTIQPIREIAEILDQFRSDIPNPTSSNNRYPVFHTDAVQAWNYLDCTLSNLNVGLMTLSGHKCYGPKGVGVLAFRRASDRTVSSIVTGGGQEFGLRSGTQNVAGIVGCAVALELAAERRERDTVMVGKLAALFFKELSKRIPGIEVNGVPVTAAEAYPPQLRAPHILNISLPKGCTLELVVALDQAGVAVSTGSACASRASAPSHVLRAMGFPEERIRRSLRVSFGRMTTAAEVREVVQRIGEVLKV